MALWLKVLATKTDGHEFDPPGWWKERTNSCKLSPDLHVYTVTYTCPFSYTYRHTINKYM